MAARVCKRSTKVLQIVLFVERVDAVRMNMLHLSRLAVRAHIGGICRASQPLCRYVGALSLQDDEHLSLGGSDYGHDATKDQAKHANSHQQWLRDSIGAVSGRFVQQVRLLHGERCRKSVTSSGAFVDGFVVVYIGHQGMPGSHLCI